MLRDRELAGLDSLRLRQSEHHHALIDLCADLVRVDRWIELKCPPIIFATRFMMNQRSLNHRQRATPRNRQLVVLDRNFETFLAYTRHLDLQSVTVGVFDKAGSRRQDLFALPT